MKTTQAKKGQVPQHWYHVSADGQVLGRLAVRIARVLMGKHKPEYTPHVDTGDFVVVTHAERVVLTGRKAQTKTYASYTGYPGGLRVTPYARMLERHPDRILRLAVQRMLPKSKLGRVMFSKLKVYAGDTHPHAAQQPKPLPEYL